MRQEIMDSISEVVHFRVFEMKTAKNTLRRFTGGCYEMPLDLYAEVYVCVHLWACVT